MLCSCLHKYHKMKLLPLCCLFLTFVFYGNTLYLCKTTIDKNSYEIVMKQRQHIFQSLTIEVVMVLLASTISFPMSDALSVQLSILPFVMVACYVALKLIFRLCLSLSEHLIAVASLFLHKPTQSGQQTKDDAT